MNQEQSMFHPREVDWSYYEQPQENPMLEVLDIRNGNRRLLAQSPITMEYMVQEQSENNDNDIYHRIMAYWNSQPNVIGVLNDGAESDGYDTPDEDFDHEETDGDHHESLNTTTRRNFTTPCGQTYWVDEEYLLYTNETVEFPIGYWSVRDQCVYFEDCWGDTDDDDDDEDEYDPPPTPPPLYEESDSSRGTPAPNDDEEVEGETIVFTVSQ